MFANILGKKKSSGDNSEIALKISKMNLTEMKSFISDKSPDNKLDEDSLIAIMKRLMQKDDKTSKYYIQADDMESKIKKAFDLVILIASSKKITVFAIELIQEFVTIYADIIAKYDKDNKEIYTSRFKDSINNAANRITKIAEINNRMSVTKQ